MELDICLALVFAEQRDHVSRQRYLKNMFPCCCMGGVERQNEPALTAVLKQVWGLALAFGRVWSSDQGERTESGLLGTFPG